MRKLLSFLVSFTAMGAGAAERMSVKEFNDTRGEIRLLTANRIRAAPEDSRALVTGENRLRALFEEFQVRGGTPPVNLSAEVSTLRAEGRRWFRLRSAGQIPAADPAAATLVARGWNFYEARRDDIFESAEKEHRAGKSESTVYWSALRAFEDLRAETESALVHNTPPGELSLAAALVLDRNKLLKMLEVGPKKTRGSVRALVPAEHPPAVTMDASAFYHAVDLLPDAPPVSQGALTVPVGFRTVTERRAGARLVMRPTAGGGVAYVGSEEVNFQYGYLTIPPDTPYYFENTGKIPLEIEFVALKP